jgi:hypothetical protein
MAARDALYEAEARTLKAHAYADVLKRHQATAEATAQLPEEGWEAIRQLCAAPYNARPLASGETRAVVVALLEAAEAAALLSHGCDPFEGL